MPASKIISTPDWHLFITRMEMKWTKWYAMTSHVIAYRSLELLFGTHTFHFNCFFEDFNCVFTQIRCLSRVLEITSQTSCLTLSMVHCSMPGSQDLSVCYINTMLLTKKKFNDWPPFFATKGNKFHVSIILFSSQNTVKV